MSSSPRTELQNAPFFGAMRERNFQYQHESIQSEVFRWRGIGVMFDWFAAQHPATQALLGGLFTWAITAVGAALVFFTAEVNRRLRDAMLGFAAGVMIAPSLWSLLAPAIEIAGNGPVPVWLPASVGFLFGGAVIWCIDKILPHLHLCDPIEKAEGVSTSWRHCV
jgi:ZIP family zinc transporter